MISHRHQCVFIHIPKAAGQSIESVFVEANNLTWAERAPLLLKPNSNKLLGPPRLAHLKASEYVACGHITAEKFQQYYKFAFVRNPWDRLVSEYNYRKKHGDLRYQCTFKKFLFEYFPTPDLDDYTNAKDYYRHIVPQWKFIYDESNNCLVDFIGKFESLQKDFGQVAAQLNLSQTTLPHKNNTHSKAERLKQYILTLINKQKTKLYYSDFYDLESMEFVKELYKKDIALFEYQFEDRK